MFSNHYFEANFHLKVILCVKVNNTKKLTFSSSRILRQDAFPENDRIRQRRRQWQIKLARLTAVAVAAFMLSWSPYCLVSLISIFKGDHLLSPGEAEVPELMAKASVIYNPFVYTIMNRRFRRTLSAMVSRCRYCKWHHFRKNKDSSTYIQECDTEIRFSTLQFPSRYQKSRSSLRDPRCTQGSSEDGAYQEEG